MENSQRQEHRDSVHFRDGEAVPAAGEVPSLWAQDVHHPKVSGGGAEGEGSPGDGDEAGAVGGVDEFPGGAEDRGDVRLGLGPDDDLEKCAASGKRDPL